MLVPNAQLRDRLPGQFDARAEVNASVALQLDERAKEHIWIGFRIDRNYQAAAALEQFVQAEIFDVAAVREIDVVGILIEAPEHLPQEIPSRDFGEIRDH